jgi:hypothetical protein
MHVTIQDGGQTVVVDCSTVCHEFWCERCEDWHCCAYMAEHNLADAPDCCLYHDVCPEPPPERMRCK